MKGIVFSEFFELVENRFGYDMVDTIIENANLPHNGIYVSGGTYPHGEMVSLVVALSNESKIPVPKLLEVYGEYLFGRLMSLYPALAADKNNPIEFMAGIDNYIHVEVRKLYPDAELPKFETIECNDNSIVLDYISERGMQDFGVGLMKGCGAFFKTALDIRYEKVTDAAVPTFRFFVSLA